MPWTPAPLIDPQLGLSRAECRAITRAAWQRWMRRPRYLALYFLGLVIAVLAYHFVPEFVHEQFGPRRWYHFVLWWLLYVGAIYALTAVLRRVDFAPFVYAALREQGHDVCPRCGYMLRGLPESAPRCPECGADRPRRPRARTGVPGKRGERGPLGRGT